jgi:3-oxoacyl-(acyl-carrier-protein) synthase
MKISGGNWRVVVTGLSVVSPNGLGRVEFREATRKGISGIAAITVLNAEKLSCRVAGEVKIDTR